MKLIKPGTYTKSVCFWCPAPAAWRSAGMAQQRYACVDHRTELREHEVGASDGRMTEADYQTWYRL